MFGLSFGELVVLVIVAVVVIGPKDLPRVLRKLGQWAAKARRMAADLRAQSGIDDVLREGDIGENIAEIRRLARGELNDIKQAATVTATAVTANGSGDPGAPVPALPSYGNGSAHHAVAYAHDGDRQHALYGGGHLLGSAYDEVEAAIARDREYPREAADSYHALPDHAVIYHDDPLPASKHAEDPVYATGAAGS